LKLSQIKRFHLGRDPGDRVPTLQEFLQACLHWGLQRPIALEIKSIRTDQGRQKLIDLFAAFKHQYLARQGLMVSDRYDLDPDGVGFLAFKSNFKKSFGKDKATRRYWCEKMREAGFNGVHRTIFHRHNLCSL
jgi:hypothetical protein